MSTPLVTSVLKPDFNFNNFNLVENIRQEANSSIAEKPIMDYGLLTVLPANTWMLQAKDKPVPKMLFSEFWHQDELCILFADSNLGKSILAVQIADSISKGVPIPGFKLEAPAQKVIYCDFELSDKQFQNRYSIDYEQLYCFHENFFRAELNPDVDIEGRFESFEEYLIQSIEKTIEKHGARILIIDNITYLGTDNERAKDALPLMKRLKALKSKYQLSALVLAHTPKRDASKPLTLNDVQGSKMLMNFCDSSFAIGLSQEDNRLRYLKQIKQRNTELVYGEDNVCLCHIVKTENFLQFELLANAKEWEHLRQPSDDDRELKREEAKKLQQQGLTQRQIAKQLNLSVGSVNNYLNA